MSPGNLQCPARDKIVLDVDDQQGIAGNGLESRVERCGGSSTLARLDSALRECEHLVECGARRDLERRQIWGNNPFLDAVRDWIEAKSGRSAI